MLKAVRSSDLVLGLFVVAIAAMLLVPLPTMLLDFLLVINISFSLVLLLAGLYMPNALALLAFPSLLLLTTLFRLGLNVASTRLILSEGYAGQVIEAFGSFLIRGEILVGMMIFSIITIVNFIVIARGSSRVSEVAARFALDALPGKQLAIDSDLRAGIITASEAQYRREELRKESQLYGSMDGAMKFVQGDAIAGFAIIFINIVGGIYLGITNGLSFSEAIHTYTILTVGDGLVTQIPAILISICAGIVVTRVSSGENSTLGSELAVQLFSKPGTLLFAGALLMGIAAMPGLPAVPFVAVGLALAGNSFYLRRRQAVAAQVPAIADFSMSPPGLPEPGRGAEEDQADETSLVIALDSALLHKLYRINMQRYRAWWNEFRTDFYSETGVRLPDYRVVADEHCAPSTYTLLMGGTQVESGSILLDSAFVELNPDHAEMLGLQVLMEAQHPLAGNRVFWATQTPALRRIVEAANIRTFDFMEYIFLRIGVFFNSCPEEVVTLTEVHGLLKQVDKKYPGLLGEAFNKDYINVSRMTELLQELVREGVNIRDIKQIIESVAAYCSTYGLSLVQDQDFDLQDLVSFVRGSRKRHIVAKLLSSRRSLKVFTLSPDVEAVMESAQSETRSGPLSVDPDVFDRLHGGLSEICGPILKRGLLPVSVLCRADLRPKVSGLLRGLSSPLNVVTFEELDPAVPVEQVAIWEIKAA